MSGGRIQFIGRQLVQEHLRGRESVRIDRMAGTRLKDAEPRLPGAVQTHHGHLLAPLVPQRIPNGHRLEEHGGEAVHGRGSRREPLRDDVHVGLRKGEQVPIEFVHYKLIDRVETHVDVLHEDEA